MRRNWKVVQHSSASRWAVKYASINPQGDIALSRVTLESLGNPKAIVLFYDPETEAIGLKAARSGEEYAFPVRKNGTRGGHIVRGFKLIKEHNVKLTETLKFQNIELDAGVLVLDLKTAEPVRRS